MKAWILLFIFLFGFFSWSCKDQKPSKSLENLEGIFEDLGSLHHPVNTKSEEAQKFFDQGFTLIYGFNHEEAVRSFQQALKYDSNLAIAYWGIAFCYGSNYNWPADMHATRKAYENILTAKSLSDHAAEKEKDYINTLASRYTDDSTADLRALEIKYSAAMKSLSEKYPDDLDAKTLYAESMMNLHPWELWMKDGNPNENTLAIVAALEEVLAADSLHIGANHYYIHAVEASPHPEKALASARRLATLVPNAGHLVHMPAHVYMRTGNYAMAGHANHVAARVDSDYIHSKNISGIYPMIYYTHNLHFLAVARHFEGKDIAAKQSLNECLKQIDPMMVIHSPMMQFLTASPFQLAVGAGDWDGIMSYPKPDSFMNITVALWHWARAMAFLEKDDIKSASAEQKDFEEVVKTIPADQTYGLSLAQGIGETAANILYGKMSEKQKDLKAAEKFYGKAVTAEKNLHYDEPPDWFVPSNNMLGGFFLRIEKYAEAEKAFVETLKEYPNHGKALFGLEQALRNQNKNDEAARVKAEFDAAWKNAEKPLTIQAL